MLATGRLCNLAGREGGRICCNEGIRCHAMRLYGEGGGGKFWRVWMFHLRGWYKGQICCSEKKHGICHMIFFSVFDGRSLCANWSSCVGCTDCVRRGLAHSAVSGLLMSMKSCLRRMLLFVAATDANGGPRRRGHTSNDSCGVNNKVVNNRRVRVT